MSRGAVLATTGARASPPVDGMSPTGIDNTPMDSRLAVPATLPTVSVVIPVYNSELSLPELVRRLEPVLPRIASRYEVIMVNDGSRDASWSIIIELAATYDWVRGIDMLRNYGQHNALLCGVRAATHELIVTMDDDLQHPPEELPRLMTPIAAGFDVVYGTPAALPHELWRNLASKVTKLALQTAMGAETARKVSAWRVFRAPLRDAFQDFRSPFLNLDVLLTWGSTKFSSVAVRHDPRTLGKSNYTFRKLITHAVNMMTGFSTLPLQLASLIGFFFTLFGIGVLVYVLSRYVMYGSAVSGFPFLASTIALFSGAQLFALGIIGEYLARMHFRMMERPTYTVRTKTQ